MVVASVYVPSSLHLDVFRTIHAFTWMVLMMYIHCTDCEVGSECLTIMSSETYVGHLCFHSNLATFSRWGNFPNVVLSPCYAFFKLFIMLETPDCWAVCLYVQSPDSMVEWKAGRVTHVAKNIVHTGFWLGNLRERYHLKDLSVDGRIILKWIFEEI